ncbi:hypothetical protein LTR84_005788 [Exophiala bonariae]|uniref:Zn(2)-C6 fungal-type domain-containing protein n=1 Tax=Exophiala bonariae TaxID=1690606 RepID=A0AAV9N462_9EURO|nr:hypothetical protein LTR84_005788 [Exophiala bonariae]
MPLAYRVRFARTGKTVSADFMANAARQESQGRCKSRSGCQECKARKVKCDETFPVCDRCRRRGAICRKPVVFSNHGFPTPWLATNSFTSVLNLLPTANKEVLKWWLHQASHILAFEPDSNPLSFPILRHLLLSPALLHALQSLSGAHQSYFERSCIPACLEERSKALILVKHELQYRTVPLMTSFLSVFILGVASPWLYREMQDDFGHAHIKGARAILELMAEEQHTEDESSLKLALGYYLYWDMHTAFLVPTAQVEPLDTPTMSSLVARFKDYDHPLAGCSIALLYQLGIMGRYCRGVLDTGDHDYNYEDLIEEFLLNWQPTSLDTDVGALSRAYQLQGLILLYRICGRPSARHLSDEVTLDLQLETDLLIQSYVKELLESLTQTPLSKPAAIFYGLVMVTAGAELGEADTELRAAVKQRLKANYSCVRVTTDLWAIVLLEEVWSLRAAGIMITPLELMLQRNWMLSMA